MCELRLLACVKDLLSRLFSMIQVSSGFSLLYSLLGKATALQKISHLLATCLDAFRLSSHFIRLSTDNSVAVASIILSVVSITPISYRW
jgi:hypothetical protein